MADETKAQGGGGDLNRMVKEILAKVDAISIKIDEIDRYQLKTIAEQVVATGETADKILEKVSNGGNGNGETPELKAVREMMKLARADQDRARPKLEEVRNETSSPSVRAKAKAHLAGLEVESAFLDEIEPTLNNLSVEDLAKLKDQIAREHDKIMRGIEEFLNQ